MEWAPPHEGEDQWLVRQLASEPPQALRWVVTVGDREAWLSASRRTHRLASNRHLHAVLHSKGYSVHYRERSHGHDYLAWRSDLAWGLEHLFAPAGP
jgi:enterochelin esterase family protein